jgi:NADH:ubiquinone oxidoreductase subunit 5 (subunit L)/multisubunit Na+/H+ antiporter MnhA subunit
LFLIKQQLPTPVSALLHAATLVTAGIFLLLRISPVLEFAPLTLTVLTFLGGITAFLGGSLGLVANDMKKVIAYSTMSQLGYQIKQFHSN